MEQHDGSTTFLYEHAYTSDWESLARPALDRRGYCQMWGLGKVVSPIALLFSFMHPLQMVRIFLIRVNFRSYRL